MTFCTINALDEKKGKGSRPFKSHQKGRHSSVEGSVDVHFETDIIELKEQMVVNSMAQKKLIEKNKTKRLLRLAFTRWLFNSLLLSMLPPHTKILQYETHCTCL